MVSEFVSVGLGRVLPGLKPLVAKPPAVRREFSAPVKDTFTLRFGKGDAEIQGFLPERIANARVQEFFDRAMSIRVLEKRSERLADQLRDNIQDAIAEFARQARDSKTSGKPAEKVDGMTPEEIVNHPAIQEMPYMLDVVKPDVGLASLMGGRHEFYVMSNFLKHVKDVTQVAEEPGYRWFSFTPNGVTKPENALIVCVEDSSKTGGSLKIARGSEMEQIEKNPLLTQPGPNTEPVDSKIYARLQETSHEFKGPR